jgi:hypothetical protein
MSRKSLTFWTVVILGSLIMVCGANRWTIYAKLWHWKHGDAIQCGDRNIPVPNGWFQAGFIHECNVTAMSRHGEFAVARFYPRTDAPSANDDQWRREYSSEMMRNGYGIGRISELTVAGIPTVCVESNKSSDPKDLHIVCAVSHQMMIMLAYNDRKWESDFYNMVRGMK